MTVLVIVMTMVIKMTMMAVALIIKTSLGMTSVMAIDMTKAMRMLVIVIAIIG